MLSALDNRPLWCEPKMVGKNKSIDHNKAFNGIKIVYHFWRWKWNGYPLMRLEAVDACRFSNVRLRMSYTIILGRLHKSDGKA